MKKFVSFLVTLALGLSLTTAAFANDNVKSKEVGKYTESDVKLNQDIQKDKAKKNLEKVQQNKSFQVLQHDENGNYTFTNAPYLDKNSYLAQLAGITGQGYTRSAYYTKEATYFDNGTVSYVAGVSKLKAHHKDSVWFGKGDSTTDDTVTWDGSSDSFYYGSNPYYADKIQQTETFSCNCTTLGSASFSWPGSGSATFTKSSQSATITWDPLTTPNTYYSFSANYGGLRVDCYSISNEQHVTTANYRVGNTSYLAQASSLQNF
ncbi:hypothetical protein [Tumebacillus flagellatus]|uniref:hypothetical protein n=1 Tax=Tumebacillus flagellatus TaxID=1157490 RepID=UPI001267BA74|nr:hypothetical protein [Tumebacillus flagellatus]